MISLPRRAVHDLRTLARSPMALTVMLLFLAGAGSSIAFFPRESVPASLQAPLTSVPANGQAPQATATAPLSASERSDLEKWYASLPREIVPLSTEGAAVLIVRFSDFMCPHCAQSYFALRPVLKKYQAEMPGAVRLVTMGVPWDTSCNSLWPSTGHPGACVAAMAYHMAAAQHRGAEMEDYLYSNSATLTETSIRQAAQTTGNVKDWDNQVAAASAAIKNDLELAGLMKVHATPTYFVNGARFEGGPRTPQQWDALIRLELQRVGKLK
jgi:protein-disulfide isomerase